MQPHVFFEYFRGSLIPRSMHRTCRPTTGSHRIFCPAYKSSYHSSTTSCVQKSMFPLIEANFPIDFFKLFTLTLIRIRRDQLHASGALNDVCCICTEYYTTLHLPSEPGSPRWTCPLPRQRSAIILHHSHILLCTLAWRSVHTR